MTDFPEDVMKAADKAEMIATVKEWYEWSRQWSGSAFLNGEPTGEMSEVECKTELYRGLCSLGNHLLWLEGKMRNVAALVPEEFHAGEIPEDVMRVAEAIQSDGPWLDIAAFIQRQQVESIARAIMAETERCAKLAEGYDHGAYASMAIRGEEI